MIVAPRALLALLLPAAALAAEGSKFSCDPASGVGPADWASLDLGGPANACGGAAQSGIDVPLSRCDVTEADHVFSAGDCDLDDLRFELADHAIHGHCDTAVSGCTPPRMTIPGQPAPFEALQFHIHTGADHAIDGACFGAAMHLVHKEIGGDRLSVLGFFLDPTNPSDRDKFQDLLTEWELVESQVAAACNLGSPNDNSTSPQEGGGRRQLREGGRKLPRSFNPCNLVPEQSSMCTHEGSLTAPPCTEVVFWNVIEKPVSLSIREFLRLTNLILDCVEPTNCEVGASVAAPSGFTGRPVQPRNGRTVTHLCPTGFVDPIQEIIDNEGTEPPSGPTPTPPPGATSGSASVVSFVGVASAVVMTAANFLMQTAKSRKNAKCGFASPW